MNTDRMALGVLDISTAMADPPLANKYRDFTISWSRYDYRGEIIESDSVNEILDRAVDQGDRWCLILPYGQVLAERWTPHHWRDQDVAAGLDASLDTSCSEAKGFLVAGNLSGDAEHWFGFKNHCLLVNLEVYQQLAAPRFDSECVEPTPLPGAIAHWKQGVIAALTPSDETDLLRPSLPGWHFIAASLRARLPVVGLDESLRSRVLDLQPTCSPPSRAMSKYLGDGISSFDPERPDPELASDQLTFLNMVQPQTAGARDGVFLWNIESYDDIEVPADDIASPVSTLYSVAAGFKPNRILHTHGLSATTRVVYFDYSRNALQIRKYMIDHWDGENFPDFFERLLQEFPHPDTFYQLWDGLTPDQISQADVQRMWDRELQRWGSAQSFRDHWRACAKLQHEYVVCNIMTDPSPLFKRITHQPNAVIWWSNAFFTVYGNWFYSLTQRQQMYGHWAEQLATLNPELRLFGSDHNNSNVNSMRASDYWEEYRHADNGPLTPSRLSPIEIRM